MTTTGPVTPSSRTVQVALNGDSDHPAMPRTPADIAADAAACVVAGATVLHLHAFDDEGVETLAEQEVGRTLRAVRARCPGVPVSMTTFAQIEPDPARRLATVAAWDELPDLVPANQGEDGITELTDLLVARGVGVEACVFSVADVERFLERGRHDRFVRIVVEPMEPEPSAACDHAVRMESLLAENGVALEQVQHGMGAATWPVLRQAVQRGHGFRIGLEDTGELPDGRVAAGNPELVEAALTIARGRRGRPRG
ncbi:3-keto-5-aminohexanoate cleavage protein [Pseudonocardia sp. ICBG1293]|uniref:3-keto-5-aminohexanoate cleavage protein n=1 Tax=Pseudonocardia sp. ICBG1293 TaxID=2844382 RepID=UPI001CCBC286|nr:3-keto-5-aminohexanoate cleavage protein [Pseudonocardia sp. ICBG1293]